MNKDQRLAYFILRLALGVNIFLHGTSRILFGYTKFVQETMAQFIHSGLQPWNVEALGYAIPLIETVVGTLLILGLATRFALILGSFLIMVLIFGMSLLQKWEIVGLQMNYVFFYSLLLFLIEWNEYSADRLLLKRAQRK